MTEKEVSSFVFKRDVTIKRLIQWFKESEKDGATFVRYLPTDDEHGDIICCLSAIKYLSIEESTQAMIEYHEKRLKQLRDIKNKQ